MVISPSKSRKGRSISVLGDGGESKAVKNEHNNVLSKFYNPITETTTHSNPSAYSLQRLEREIYHLQVGIILQITLFNSITARFSAAAQIKGSFGKCGNLSTICRALPTLKSVSSLLDDPSKAASFSRKSSPVAFWDQLNRNSINLHDGKFSIFCRAQRPIVFISMSVSCISLKLQHFIALTPTRFSVALFSNIFSPKNHFNLLVYSHKIKD
jgi:hypothetical protein